MGVQNFSYGRLMSTELQELAQRLFRSKPNMIYFAQSGRTTVEREEIRALKKEVAELRRANEILKTASAFFAAAELDRRLK